MSIFLLLGAMLFLTPISDASLFKNHMKGVLVMNNHTNILSIRCFSFDDDLETHHLKPSEQFGFKFRLHAILPTSTMFNCSTNMGAFVAFRYDYECAIDTSNKCEWRFDLNQTYRYSQELQDWVAFEYNPNYESLERGGVIYKGIDFPSVNQTRPKGSQRN
ncbi:hypothetical protein LguiB_028777 [Lonicera macranthoides]